VVHGVQFLVDGKRAGEFGTAPPYAMTWDTRACRLSLTGEPRPAARNLLAFLVERSQWATARRHTSPFAGIIDYKTRDRIWREGRDRLEAADRTAVTSG
jgi:hypothetical protein